MTTDGAPWLATLLLFLAWPAEAATIYSGLDDIAIPTGFTGIYLDLDTGATSTTAFTGWDVNPFFGGVGLGNSAAFQPARVSASNLAAVLNLAPGSIVSDSLLYASGLGGSGNPGNEHLGPGVSQFQPGSEGYLGFRFTTNDSAGPYYGWMRVVFTANTGGALVKDWAYETSGGAISTGNVRQSVAVAGVQTTILSGGSGEIYTLGNVLADGANTTALTKMGSGTWQIVGSQSFTGETVVQGGTLDLGSSGQLNGTSSVTINNGGTLLLGATGITQLNDAAPVTLAGGTLASGGLIGLDEIAGALTLSGNSVIDFATGTGTQHLRFAASQGESWSGTLSIWNWTKGLDRLSFGNSASGLTLAQLSSIRFYSDAGATEIGAGFSPLMTSFGEVVPVPEPSVAVTALGLLLGVGARERRQRHAVTRRGRRVGS